MFRQVREFTVFLGLALLCMSCTRLPQQEGPFEGGSVAVETLVDRGSVPAAWGNLVSAAPEPRQPRLIRLIFEDEEGTIRIVLYDTEFSQLWQSVKVIHRQ